MADEEVTYYAGLRLSSGKLVSMFVEAENISRGSCFPKFNKDRFRIGQKVILKPTGNKGSYTFEALDEYNEEKVADWAAEQFRNEKEYEEMKRRARLNKKTNDIGDMTVNELIEYGKASYNQKRDVIAWLLSKI